MKKAAVIFSLLIIITSCKNKEFMGNYFAQHKLTGTVIVQSLKSGKTYTYNATRSEQRFLPASTFKIINTLIALQEQVIKDEHTVIKWDKKDKGLAMWNQDHSITSAFPVSCVWFYQELARRIGFTKYSAYLKTIHYGNEKTGPKLDSFWLDGDMRISAQEQITVLKNIYAKKYPFREKHYALLKKIMLIKKTSEYILRAKTGWVMRKKQQLGWYVGYVETKNDTWFFACNIDIVKPKDAQYRQKIIQAALKRARII